MLILEGPDLSGKTTLAKKLLKHAFLQQLGHMYSHFGPLPAGFTPSQYLSIASTWLVMDRFHMSELACRVVDGEPMVMSPEEYRFVDAGLRLIGAFTVVLTVDEALLRKRYADRGDDLYDIDQVIAQNNAFLDIVTGKIGDFKPDVDLHFHVVAEFGTQEMVDQIVCGYRRRLKALSDFNSEAADVDF